jgi:hypothetical protein
MSVQAINSAAMFNVNNNGATDKSGLQPAVTSGSSNADGTATDVVKLSTASTGTSGSNTEKYYDIRDTNKDGVVSAEEELQYALTHPGEEINTQVAIATNNLQAVTRYNQEGSAGTSTNKVPGLINLSV